MNAHQDEPPEFNFEDFGFIYPDYPYFHWFRQRTEDTLRAVWQWKGLHYGRAQLGDGGIPLGRIWNGQELVVQGLDNFNGVVTRAFLHHLHEPVKFPILDRYVWAAMRRMRPALGRLPQTPTHWDNHYRRYYIPFFNDLYQKHGRQIGIMNVPQIDGVDHEIVRRRVLDRALWTYGKIIERKSGDTIPNSGPK
jgi:hypothetical protein